VNFDDVLDNHGGEGIKYSVPLTADSLFAAIKPHLDKYEALLEQPSFIDELKKALE
jgi:hypothetical protein